MMIRAFCKPAILDPIPLARTRNHHPLTRAHPKEWRVEVTQVMPGACHPISTFGPLAPPSDAVLVAPVAMKRRAAKQSEQPLHHLLKGRQNVDRVVNS